MARDYQISDLPDSLVEHILSFLPTKQAVTTCLLSKSWRHLRLSLPNLDFDEFNFHNLHSFLRYIDTVTSMRDDSETLKKFQVILRSTSDSVPRMKINTLINTTVLHSKVEHVEIHDRTLNKFNIEIPSCIFKCNSITILKLSGVTVKTSTSSFVDLPSLKVLHLSRVLFPEIKGIYNLLHGCPLLQDLSLKYCSTNGPDGHSIVPINEQWRNHWVSADLHHYSFTLQERLKNLLLADVYHYPFTLESLTNVSALRINAICFLLPVEIPTFHNLIRLEIRYHSCVFGTTLLQCLQNFPELETLIIDEFNCEGKLEPSVIPQCVSSHLKEFHLGNFRGLNGEFELASFILQKARVLEIISIRRHIMSKAISRQEIMIQRLSSCPKRSENCRLLFE